MNNIKFDFQGKTILITAGTKGIGLELTKSFLDSGANVATFSRNKKNLEFLSKKLKNYVSKEKLFIFKHDLNQLNKEKAIVNKINKYFNQKIDVLINNSGGPPSRSFLKTSNKDWSNALNVNFLSALKFSKSVIPSMKSKKWGRIINIASIYGREFGGSAPYMAAKSALIAITKHTAIDLAKTGVTANCIAPGSIIHNKGSWEKFVENNSQETVNDFIKSNLPMGKFGYPEAVGDTVAFLASKNASMILGTCINVDGGQSNSLI